MAVNPQYVGWGVGLVDLDNDGWSDIFQVNGHVYPELDHRERDRAISQSTAGLPQPRDGVFEDVSTIAGRACRMRKSSRGAAFGDFDNDGDIDVLVMNMGEAPSLLRNDLKSRESLAENGARGNRIEPERDRRGGPVESAQLKLMDAVLSQSSYISHNDSRLHFGFGGEDGRGENLGALAERSRWRRFQVRPPDNLVRLVEGSGEARIVAMPK